MDHGMEAHALSDGISEGFVHLKNERFVTAFNEMFEPLAALERLALLESAKHETHADGSAIIRQSSKNQAIYVWFMANYGLFKKLLGKKRR